MSISNFIKAPNPDGSDLCFASGFEDALDPRARRSRISRNSLKKHLGSAENATLSANTTATSSSSETPDSLAASSSSLAIPNDTEKARSLPKAPRVVAVSDITAALAIRNYAHVINRQAVSAAVMESHLLSARLAWQIGFPLVLRRLLLAPRGNGRETAGTTRKRARDSSCQEYECAGTIFGCALGNVVDHACGSKYKLYKALQPLRRILGPVSTALRTMEGADHPHLVRGLCNHRVLRVQGERLRELKHVPKIDSKYGHVGVVLGISAAILAAFATMASEPSDVAHGLPEQLSLCLGQVHVALRSWRFVGTPDDTMAHEALWVEVRAIERAQVGVARARTLGISTNITQQMALCLDYYRRAVWPAGQVVCVQTQDAILKKLRSGELLDVEQPEVIAETGYAGATAPGVITLAALPSLQARADCGEIGSDASGSASSWSSFHSSDSACAEGVVHPMKDVVGIAEGICTNAVLGGRTWYYG